MHRFFIPDSTCTDENLILTDPDEVHHARHVLRCREGDRIALFNGRGREAHAEIVSLAKDRIVCRRVEIREERAPGPPRVTLACAIPKKTKFEWILEKGTELGADEVIPLVTERTEFSLQGERRERLTGRYQTVVVNAAKQSGRLWIPQVHPPMDVAAALRCVAGADVCCIPHLGPGPRTALGDLLRRHPQARQVVFFIGPEGDFTPGEVAQAVAAGFCSVDLGPSVLKVETAALAVLSAAHFFLRMP